MAKPKITEVQHARFSHIGRAKVATAYAAKHEAEAERLGTDSEVGKIHSMIAAFHRDSAAFESEMLTETDAMGKASGDELMPTGVRGVITPRPSELFTKIYGEPEEPTLTAIPRAGQPSIPQKPDVPLEFQHLVKVD